MTKLEEQHRDMILEQIADFMKKYAVTDKDCPGGAGGECICDDFETALIRVIRVELHREG